MEAASPRERHPTIRRAGWRPTWRPSWRLSLTSHGWPDATAAGHRRGTVTLLDERTDGVRWPGVRSAGVDLADLARLRLALARSGDGLAHRILTGEERAVLLGRASDPLATLTAAFGIKESVIKAIGGLPRGASYTDISVAALAQGAATPVRLRGELARWSDRNAVELLAGYAPMPGDLVLAWALALSRRRT